MSQEKKDTTTNDASDEIHTDNAGDTDRILKLEKQLAEQEEITKRAQSDYFRLKLDMDAYMKRAEDAKTQAKTDALVSMGAKLLPFITQLEQSLEHIPEEWSSHARIAGIQLIHQKANNDLASIAVVRIPADIGQDPDLTLHMPINMQDTDDDALKGKIVQVVAA